MSERDEAHNRMKAPYGETLNGLLDQFWFSASPIRTAKDQARRREDLHLLVGEQREA